MVPTESDSGSLNVVNALAVDQYVKGVIPNESPSSWPMAELRAQAVASRSFALTAAVGGNGFDLYSDTRSQVYKGLESETARSNAAAESTRGQVVEYNGKIAETYFSACSGGHTESVQNVFFGPAIPYLVGVPDPYDSYCPLHSWTLEFSGPQISSKLGGLPRRPAEAGRHHQARRLPADRLGEAVRDRRRDQGQRRSSSSRRSAATAPGWRSRRSSGEVPAQPSG